mmetsp:Transcript_13927/g.49431  ORF Transcript_13927/g.49431 Transcript_13927/m.49431 type:complete len:302 (-) Transcript_13927:12-917(-)
MLQCHTTRRTRPKVSQVPVLVEDGEGLPRLRRHDAEDAGPRREAELQVLVERDAGELDRKSLFAEHVTPLHVAVPRPGGARLVDANVHGQRDVDLAARELAKGCFHCFDGVRDLDLPPDDVRRKQPHRRRLFRRPDDKVLEASQHGARVADSDAPALELLDGGEGECSGRVEAVALQGLCVVVCRLVVQANGTREPCQKLGVRRLPRRQILATRVLRALAHGEALEERELCRGRDVVVAAVRRVRRGADSGEHRRKGAPAHVWRGARGLCEHRREHPAGTAGLNLGSASDAWTSERCKCTV